MLCNGSAEAQARDERLPNSLAFYVMQLQAYEAILMISKFVPSSWYIPIGPILGGLIYIAKGLEAHPMHALNPPSEILGGCLLILGAPLWSHNSVGRSVNYQIIFSVFMVFGALSIGIYGQPSSVFIWSLLVGTGLLLWCRLDTVEKREHTKVASDIPDWHRWAVAIFYTLNLLIALLFLLLDFSGAEFTASNIITLLFLVWGIGYIFVKDEEG